MALVVHTQPVDLTPAYNKQIFTALSDQYATTGFKYKVEVVVNGDTANTYTEYVIPRPDGWLVFDAMQWVKNYILHYFEYNNVSLSNPINLATGKNVSVSVTISEFGISPIDSETITYEAFDACLTDAQFRAYDITDYTFGGTTGLYFLSKSITTITPDSRVALNQPIFIHFIPNPCDNIIITLRRNNVAIDTVSIASFPTPVNTYDIYQLTLSTIIFTGATAQVGDVIRVDFLDSAVSLLRYSITLTEICTKYTDYVLYYLDRDGNILPFHFEYKSINNNTKKVNTVKLNKDTLNTVSGVYGSTSYDREDHVVSTAIESTIELNSGWITNTQSEQLKDLFDSPMVYLWDYNTLRSCRVTNPTYEQKKTANDKLFNYNCVVDLGITETRQRGI